MVHGGAIAALADVAVMAAAWAGAEDRTRCAV
jgi:acyl-coenzyme A thioesterase PaaI-like protein